MSRSPTPPALRVEGDRLVGELAVPIPPGTKADARDRSLDALLAAPLADIAEAERLVLAASPSAYARPLPGKDADGRVRFEITGLIEGDRIVPVRARRDRR